MPRWSHAGGLALGLMAWPGRSDPATPSLQPVSTSPTNAKVFSVGERLAGYLALTKPRIIELLLVTTVPTMFVAQGGVPSVWLMAATVIGGTLAAGGANAVNMVVERAIDGLMERTLDRPLAQGAVSPPAATTLPL